MRIRFVTLVTTLLMTFALGATFAGTLPAKDAKATYPSGYDPCDGQSFFFLAEDGGFRGILGWTENGTRSLQVVDPLTGKSFAEPNLGAGTLRDISRDGRKVLVWRTTGDVDVIDLKSGKVTATIPAREKKFLTAFFSFDASRVVTGIERENTKTVVWDAETGARIAGPLLLDGKDPETSYVPTFTPDRDRILTNQRGQALIWNIKSGQTLKGPTWGGHCRFTADGTRIVGTNFDSDKFAVTIWDAKTGKTLVGSLEHLLSKGHVSFSPDGERVVATCVGRNAPTITVWNARTGEKLLEISHHSVFRAVFSPDGSRIATTSHLNKECCIFDARTGDKLATFANDAYYIAFSPDGSRVIMMNLSADRLIVGDAKTGKNMGEITSPGR